MPRYQDAKPLAIPGASSNHQGFGSNSLLIMDAHHHIVQLMRMDRYAINEHALTPYIP